MMPEEAAKTNRFRTFFFKNGREVWWRDTNTRGDDSDGETGVENLDEAVNRFFERMEPADVYAVVMEGDHAVVFYKRREGMDSRA